MDDEDRAVVEADTHALREYFDAHGMSNGNVLAPCERIAWGVSGVDTFDPEIVASIDFSVAPWKTLERERPDMVQCNIMYTPDSYNVSIYYRIKPGAPHAPVLLSRRPRDVRRGTHPRVEGVWLRHWRAHDDDAHRAEISEFKRRLQQELGL